MTLRLNEAFSRRYYLEFSRPSANTITEKNGETLLKFNTPVGVDTFDVVLSVKPMTWGRQILTLDAAVAQRFAVQANMSQWVSP